ncbi:hypothetical protein PILCRDRAFT_12360 [Piloderma croceum F 1598]|uniref:Uncharacterized protein n=1 Tax=Piloderma croceum (strain F 1598) TaxID=765440 RepID=A0A0C3FAS6_PILCF|nr:hypothetical protein PILCRDRAFT_12360 [Piloderma croceum F 1598]
MQEVIAFAFVLPSTQSTPNSRPLGYSDLLMGLREGLGKGRAGMKGGEEMEKQEGLQDPRLPQWGGM